MDTFNPLIVLIAGATGVGSSSVAMELTGYFPVRGVTRTDTIREVMRRTLKRSLNKELFASTYVAWQETDSLFNHILDCNEDKVLFSYCRQVECVYEGLMGAIDRDINENINSIIEGICIYPGRLPRSYKDRVIEILIDVEDPDKHLAMIKELPKFAPNRNMEKKLQNFDKVRMIRDHLVNRAKKHGVPVFQNNELLRTVRQCADYIDDLTNGRYRSLPGKHWGKWALSSLK